jgi:hypothetical protein
MRKGRKGKREFRELLAHITLQVFNGSCSIEVVSPSPTYFKAAAWPVPGSVDDVVELSLVPRELQVLGQSEALKFV